MLVAKLSIMSVVRLIILLLIVSSFLCSPAAGTADEQITSPLLKKALDSIKSDKAADAAKILSGFAYDKATLYQYHYVAGRLSIAENKPLEAVEHFSKSYQYAPAGELKEAALIERAETHLRSRYYYEARASYTLFVKNYPASLMLGRAYTGLAQSLSETGLLKESLSYYDKAGNAPEILLGKANTLHRLNMTHEADKAYAAVLEKNSSLIKGSDESGYYLGENYRLLGKTSEAETWLKEVKNQPVKAKADLGLALMYLQQGKTEEALKYFNSALVSKDRATVRQALLNMSDIEFKAGKLPEAKARLEEIRLNYPYGKQYEEAILKLARLMITEGSYEQAGKYLNELSLKASIRQEALEEYQRLLNEVRGKDRELFVKLWKTGGPLLLDASREKFLLEAAEDLRSSGKPFIDLMQYLAKHGTESAKTKSLSALAGYYSENNELNKAGEYIQKLKSMKGAGEELVRLEAKLAFVSRDYKTASQKLLQLKKLLPADLAMLSDIVSATKDIPQALARYEKAVKESGADAKSYVRLGDIMYELGRQKDALGYYRLSVGKEGRHDWAFYRIGSLTEGAEAEEALKKVGSEDPMLLKLTEARLMEIELVKKGVGSY